MIHNTFCPRRLIPIKDVPNHLPRRSNGKRVHLATIYRWIQRGVRGVRLETILIGGRRYVSRDALDDFIAHLNNVSRSIGVDAGEGRIKERVKQLLRAPRGGGAL